MTDGLTLNGGVSSYGSGAYAGTDGDNFMWFDAIAELAALTDGTGSVFQYWCQACAAFVQPQLVNLNSISAEVPPVYGCFDAETIAAASEEGSSSTSPLCVIFAQWMYSSWWATQTGGLENTTCGYQAQD